jgi:uncharacterized membrane protein HdeD (DUF308 family)
MTEERPIWDSQPWKLAVVATVAVAAGVKMLLTDWTLAGLTAFVALLLVASGALRIVITRSFRGLPGAFAALGAGGDVAVGATLLGWPMPTLIVLTLIVGAWIAVRAVVDATIEVATRTKGAHWLPLFLITAVQCALGVVLIIRPGGTVRAAGILIGATVALQAGLIFGAAIVGRRSTRRLAALEARLAS